MNVEKVRAARHLFEQGAVLRARCRAVVSDIVIAHLLTVDDVVAGEAVRILRGEVDQLEAARVMMARSAPGEQAAISGWRGAGLGQLLARQVIWIRAARPPRQVG